MTIKLPWLLGWASVLSGAALVCAQDPPPRRDLPADELRLDPAVFRAGLKKLGLNEVLALHLQDFPPADEVDRQMMTRDIKMAEFQDQSLPHSDRYRAAEQADAILERLITDHSQDPRRFDWTFELARSLIYDQAESELTQILYQESYARADDRLSALTSRAVGWTGQLQRGIDAEYERIDALSAEAFDAIERDGFVDRLDALAPRASYLRAWALFYDSFHRRDDDPRKASQLNELRAYFRQNPEILTTPHEQSHVQVQALLLAGMTTRALQDHPTSRDTLRRAIAVAESLGVSDRARVGWAVALAWIELARSLRDAHQFDKAMTAQEQLLRDVSGDESPAFGLRLAAALLARSIWQARAKQAAENGNAQQESQFQSQSWKTVAGLMESDPDRRDEIYATLYHTVDPQAPLAQLDPLELCAGVAGALNDATHDTQHVDESLSRARALAERFLTHHVGDAAALTPHVLFNLAVALYRQGDTRAAAQRFFEVARDFPSFEMAYRAISVAVQLYASRMEDTSDERDDDSRAAYRAALELLLHQYPGTEAEAYWRFYYAQLLGESGAHEAAALQYALVDPGHEHYVESIFLQLHERAISLHQRAKSTPDDLYEIRNRADRVSRLVREFNALVLARPELRKDREREVLLEEMLARSRVINAEAIALAQVNRPDAAVEMLSDFETRFPDQTELLGRVWRVRLLSLERLGRLQEAVDSIPTYVQRDPNGAGRTLQSLYDSITMDVIRFRARSDDPGNASASSKARIGILLARQLQQWSELRGTRLDPKEQYHIRLQWAEALLSAGQYAEARTEFEALTASEQEPGELRKNDDALRNPRLTFGLAEARFRTGDFEDSLPLFNKLATDLEPGEPMRWRALLRDLQCRSNMNEPPEGIIKVIRQQQFLFPEMGGPELADEFERIMRENQRIIDARTP